LSQKALSFYKKIPFVSKTQTVEIMHSLEKVYIEAVIGSDREALKYALKGLIRCKHLLGIDASTYEKEYASYHFVEKKYRPKTVKKEKTKIPEEKPLEHFLKDKKTDIYVKDIKVYKDEIKIVFNKNINFTDVLFFELNFNKKYKDIYDIKAILPKSIEKDINIQGLNRVELSQNSKQKIRLVLEDRKNIKSSAFVKDNKLVIHIANLKQKDTKEQIVKNKIKVKELFNNKSYKKIKKYSKSIVIDPGHGGKDSGAVGYNRYQEKRSVLSIALKLRNILKKRGYRVYMTRSSDRFIDLKDRTHFANIKKADLFISIHANAVEGRKRLTQKGIETFYLSPARSARAKRVAAKENRASMINMDILSKNTLLNFVNREKIIQSNKLAIDIQANILKNLRAKYHDIKDGGVRPAPFWVLVGAGMPSVLVEVGYITNPIEAQRLFNPFYQNRIAKGLADGIESYFLKN
jgi:N-acetylmuramoyl-L-alanine amidase